MLPTINLQQTGRNIAALRKRAGLTVADLQSMLGLGNPQTIYKWQRGDTLPTLDNLVALAMIFHVTLDDIVAVG